MKLAILVLALLPATSNAAGLPFETSQQHIRQNILELQEVCLEAPEDQCTAAALETVRKQAANPCILAGFLQFEGGEDWSRAVEEALAKHGRAALPCLSQFRLKPVRINGAECHSCGGPYPYRISHAERKTRYNALMRRITGLQAPWLESNLAARVERVLAVAPKTVDADEAAFAKWWEALDALRQDQSPEADATLVALMDFVLPELRHDLESEICLRGARITPVLRRFQKDPPFAPTGNEPAEYDRFWLFQEMIDTAEGREH